MNGCGIETVSFSAAKETKRTARSIGKKRTKDDSPKFFSFGLIEKLIDTSQVLKHCEANQSKPQTILSLQVTLKR